MIIIASKPGALGNLLIVYANLLAYSREHGIELRNPAFHQYLRYFEGTKDQRAGLFSYWFHYAIARMLVRLKVRGRNMRAIHLDWSERIDLDTPNAFGGSMPRRLWLQGWVFRGERTLTNRKSELLMFFRPVQEFRKQVDDFFATNFASGETVIGVHVRRGDYKAFRDGRYYYDDAVYIDMMRHSASRFTGRKLRFLICSDERLPEALISQPGAVAAPGQIILDLYLLAKCDYIIAPPSTFSMWASWYGEVPLYMIEDPHAALRPEQFEVVKKF